MENQTIQDQQKNISWNGISLEVPVVWEIESLDLTHMLIGQEGSPRIELKWIDSPKKFTLEKYLKKFISASQRSLNIKIVENSCPDFYSRPNSFFDIFVVAWESEDNKGVGVLIFCNNCKRLSLIRFFSGLSFEQNSIAILILNSFIDHPMNHSLNWDLFGMNFSTPDFFKLSDYSFQPGSYRLEFKYKRYLLEFYSWGPAQFLLEKTDLTEFALARVPKIKGFATTGENTLGSFLKWEYRSNRVALQNLFPIFNKLALFSLFKICHDAANNRILAICIESPKQYEYDILKGSNIGG